jgi:acyl transferase domain-containing protein
MASENAESHEYTEREQEEEDLLEPIAVCGISLKFPQDACTEQGLWTMINEKRNAMSEFPPDRLNIDAFHGSFQRNTLRTRGGHFLREDIGLFDAGFFSITPSEAAGMDPMQRILLETTFHAFESCGLRIEDIRGSRTSVHVGCFTSDYLQLLMKDSVRLPPYAAMSTQSMLANRLSWFFDLRGPSVNLDSACSSSAMAIDLACQLLHTRKTDMALVAGCNILLDPDFSIALNNMQMLSPDGKCFAFDHRGNGYSRGEGVAVVVLKRLSDALTNNDPIRAIIRAVACNQDGRTPGITQPDANAQARLIHETYDQAGLSMKHTRFFEAHGTGTAIGDPIEVAAIAECFRKHRTAEDPLHVGSIKTNIGHLEGAAGIAGFIKAVLAVECGVIPPNVNFESINRRLAAYDCFMALPQDCVSWPSCTVRRASVNSFGYGGTNCHIIVDDANSYLSRKRLSVNPKDMTGSKTGLFSATSDLNAVDSQCQRGKHMNSSTSVQHPKLLVWSASTKAALGELIGLWKDYCLKVSSTVGTIDLADVAYTLDSRRSALCMSSFAIVSTVSDFLNLSDITSIQAERPQEAPRIAFIFTGQGAQWYAMGRELFIFPTYEKLIQRCETILQDFGCPWSVQGMLLHKFNMNTLTIVGTDEMLKDEDDSRIDDPSLAQTLTTVLQIGLVGLLRYLGVHPVATLGHSMGEIAAA